jgi:signal transduction histidine kinase
MRMPSPPARALALLCLLLLAATAPQAGSVVRVGVYQNSPKVDYQGEAPPQGIFVDVIEEIARREDWSLEYVRGTFSQGMARLDSGAIDLMPDVALTTARERQYAFHHVPVLSSWNQVYARRGSGIRSLLDLNGARVAVLEGSTQQDFFLEMVRGYSVKVSLLPQPDYATAFAAVGAGRADAVVTNPHYGALHAAKAGLEDTAIIFKPTGLYFAAAKTAPPALLAAIDRDLLAFKQDPRSPYYRSLERWTGTTQTPLLPAWLKWAVLAAAVLLAAALIWAVTLRRTAARLRASEQRQRDQAAELGQVLTRLQTRTADLQLANEELQTFSYSVSHDLRGPLATIAGFTSKVLMMNEGQLDARSQTMIKRVLAAARRMEELIDDLLALAQVSRQEMAPAAVDLSALAAQIVDDLRQGQPEREVEVVIEPGMVLHADRSLVRIALENLIGNAWKFTARTAQPRLEVSLAEHEDGPVCRVRDNGAGFDMQYAQKLFAPFERLHNEAEFKGSGIGLSIVQRVVARHGGRVWAHGQPGAGAEFYFSLPRAAPAAPCGAR